MKKLYAFILFSTCLSTADAQITISNSDMPVVNDTVRISSTFDQWSIDVNQTGPNFNWDFSFLTPNSQTVDTFFAVNSTPFAYQLFFNNIFLYPNHKADYAAKGTEFDLFGMVTVTDVYNFYKNGGNKYKNVGFGANINGLPASIRNIPIDTVYDFPLTDGSSYTSYSAFELSVPGTFFLREEKNVVSAIVDGYGNITIPMGTYACIRVRMEIEITDSIYVDALGFGFSVPRPTEVQYHWLATEMKVPVLQINETAGVIGSIRYQDEFVYNIGVNEITNENLVLYPNPANEFFILENPGVENSTIEIFDLSGKIVHTQNANQSIEKIVIPVNTLAEGAYLVKLSGAKSNFTGKLMVVR